MTAKQAIEVINRRAETLSKLFGAHSNEFEQFSTDMANYDIYTNNKGILQIRNTAENRKSYRQLTAFAKRVQKTNVKVLERKAKKQREEWEQEFQGESTYSQDDMIRDYNVYQEWLKQFDNYFESCYALAVLDGYSGKAAYDYADFLYNDADAYTTEWNFYYDHGEFDSLKAKYEEQQFYRENVIDPETGEVIPVDTYEDF